MRVRIEEVGTGQHPSEKVVKIDTVERPELLIVDKRAIREDKTLDVGYAVGRQNGHVLVELPRETFSGAWRVWVDKGITLE
jgi:hypothetical protein